ncbi:hypothetical protein KKF05_00825 [Patescibacteria group bacterium]|nr:hypothetical protein [Patescibacteria group bacterium]MBU1029347.1 hypothetical protein [Patescibacteria group bacterium]MBU1915886.1 hypothetical protein [Patescibacteria group bacterium]
MENLEREKAWEEAARLTKERQQSAETQGEVRDLIPDSNLPMDLQRQLDSRIEATHRSIAETVYGEPASFGQNMIKEGRSILLGNFTCALAEVAPSALLAQAIIDDCQQKRDRRIEQLRGEISGVDESGEL